MIEDRIENYLGEQSGKTPQAMLKVVARHKVKQSSFASIHALTA